MKPSTKFPAVFVSVILVIYTILLSTGAFQVVTGSLFLLSPFLVCWMVYRIIRYDAYHGPELKDEEEWGYADKKREELNTF